MTLCWRPFQLHWVTPGLEAAIRDIAIILTVGSVVMSSIHGDTMTVRCRGIVLPVFPVYLCVRSIPRAAWTSCGACLCFAASGEQQLGR